MESVLPQPPRPPRDATQRLLRLVLNHLGIALFVLWALTALGAVVAAFAFSATIAWDLLHVFLALTALLCLRLVLLGVVLARAPSRLNPKALAAVARRTSRPQRLGQLYVWLGAWLAIYFAASVALVPCQPLQSWTLPPSLIALGVALPIVGIIARGPVIAHQAAERRRARAS